jgi:hypothetical protein
MQRIVSSCDSIESAKSLCGAYGMWCIKRFGCSETFRSNGKGRSRRPHPFTSLRLIRYRLLRHRNNYAARGARSSFTVARTAATTRGAGTAAPRRARIDSEMQ